MVRLSTPIAMALAARPTLRDALAQSHDGGQRAAAPPLLQAWHGPLATNAGGVIVFNLTDLQTELEVRIWESDVLTVNQLATARSVDFSTATTKPSLVLVVKVVEPPELSSLELFLCTPQGPGQPECRELLPRDAPRIVPMFIAVPAPPNNRTKWVSYDRANMRIKYGKGYHMVETTEATWSLKGLVNDTIATQLFGNNVKVATLCTTPGLNHPQGGGAEDARPTVEFDRLPLTTNRPPKVKDSTTLTLEDLDSPQFIFSADLPSACQVLYKNITGTSMALNEELAAAISYSIVTPGKALHERLVEKEIKEPGFGYLRVTLGNQLGDGPGIPYVLEIWPGGSKSPIHNHGNVCAVIKVLHGEIQVDVYNKLTELLDHHQLDQDPSRVPGAADRADRDPPTPLTSVELKEGDITWMDANWYQCHQLINPHTEDRGKFCATIQCYKYDDDDHLAWPGFDYIQVDQDELVHLFHPDSDFTFGKMKYTVLEEYRTRLQ